MADLSRRALIAAAPAALVAAAPASAFPSVGVTTTQHAADLVRGTSVCVTQTQVDVPDAALRELVRAHAEAHARFDALTDRYIEASNRYAAELPAPPEALFRRAWDWGFFPDPDGLHTDCRAYYRPTQMDAIRNEYSGRFVAALPEVRKRVEARRAEILAAGKEYGAVEAAIAASTGLQDAEADYNAEALRVSELRRQLVEARPETIESALLKIEAAALSFVDLADVEDWLADQQGATAETIAISALRDIMRIAGYLPQGSATDVDSNTPPTSAATVRVTRTVDRT